jgi:SH3 domain-containing YSC84-like protein 1
MKMMKVSIGIVLAAALARTGLADNKDDVARRLKESATVLSEIMAASDKSIPQDLLDKAHCVVIVPGLKKGAFIFGGKYGKGFISCRRSGHPGWSAPGAVRVEGGSVGFQIGGSESDVVMLVLNARGADRLLQSKFTVGAEGEVAAGPVGRDSTAQTDAKMTAEILSWSRSRGVFAGISLQGATLREDKDDNKVLYGEPLKNADVIDKWHSPTPEASALLEALKKYSPTELK